MTVDHLDRRHCLDRLAHSEVGRVAFTERALPSIQPVGYTLVGDLVVLRPGHDALAETLNGQIVAFEVSEIDPVTAYGWSVVVTGAARSLVVGTGQPAAVAVTGARIAGRCQSAAEPSRANGYPPGQGGSLVRS